MTIHSVCMYTKDAFTVITFKTNVLTAELVPYCKLGHILLLLYLVPNYRKDEYNKQQKVQIIKLIIVVLVYSQEYKYCPN